MAFGMIYAWTENPSALTREASDRIEALSVASAERIDGFGEPELGDRSNLETISSLVVAFGATSVVDDDAPKREEKGFSRPSLPTGAFEASWVLSLGSPLPPMGFPSAGNASDVGWEDIVKDGKEVVRERVVGRRAAKTVGLWIGSLKATSIGESASRMDSNVSIDLLH
jgi:hypothetical protein